MPRTFPVTCHTKYVGEGSTFVAIKGFALDGTHFIQQALQQGATTIVVQHDALLDDPIVSMIATCGAHLIRVADARLALAHLSAQAAGYPARSLKIIGITGTKGKTTSAFLLEHTLRSAGHTTALMSTVKNNIAGTDLPMQLTTPQPDYLHQFFKLCVQAGVEYVVMEVAAQALTMHRVDGIVFDGILFTNFAQEHAEFYATQDEYFKAKCMVLTRGKDNAPIFINADDSYLAPLCENKKYKTFALNHPADATARVMGSVRNGITCEIQESNNRYTLSCPSLIGMFNVYNLLGVVSMSRALGISVVGVQQALQTFGAVPGRLQGYTLPNGARCFIDYAHNPSSYQALLSTLRELTDHLIVLFGCGGERDKSKRPLMGEIAARYADVVVLTSDNPRSENPADIIKDIEAGIAPEHVSKVVCELDRAVAIQKAYSLSCADGIIVLLGKGPDEYQHIGTVKYPFSEAEIVQGLK